MVCFWKSRRRRELETIMSDVKTLLDTAVETANALKANTVEVSAKLDRILTKLDELRSAGGASAEQLTELVSSLQEAAGTLQTVEDKEDTALAEETPGASENVATGEVATEPVVVEGEPTPEQPPQE